MSLDWALFEQQLLQEDGSIVIVFKNKENGKDPQQIHIRTIYVSVMIHYLKNKVGVVDFANAQGLVMF